MSAVREVGILALAWLGAGLIAIAAIGIVRMPDLFTRLQAASKASALGVAFLAMALSLRVGDIDVAFRAATLVLIVFLTAPIAAHLIARAGFVTRTELEEATVIDEAAGVEDRPPVAGPPASS